MKLLTIVMPVYNVEDYIKQALDSYFSQEDPKVELIVVDDGSLDSSYDIIVDNYQDKIDAGVLRLLRQENGGVSRARNRALENASGKYITFFDSDDVILDGYIKSILNAIEKFNADVVEFGFKVFENFRDINLSPSCFVYDNFGLNNVCSVRDFIYSRSIWYPCIRAIKREFFSEKKFPEGVRFCEDLMLLTSIYQDVRSIYHIDKALYGYRLNKNGATLNVKPCYFDNLMSFYTSLDNVDDRYMDYLKINLSYLFYRCQTGTKIPNEIRLEFFKLFVRYMFDRNISYRKKMILGFPNAHRIIKRWFKKVKIVFRISKLGFGGAEQVFLSLAREFKRIEGTAICFVVDRLGSENVATAIETGHRVHCLNASRTMNSIIPFSSFLKSEQPDIIISAYTDTNAATLLSALIAGQTSRVIVTEHASLTEHWRKKSNLKKMILKIYVSHIYKLSQSVICVSKGLSGQVSQLMGSDKKVSTIYNPVRFTQSDVSKEFSNEHKIVKLVAVGRITEQKDYPTLIRSLAKLTESNSFHLTIVGGIFCEGEFESVNLLIQTLNLQDKVTFSGYTDKVEEYYRDADIFVLSSAWEGFGNVIVEAMSFGLPIVSTNCNYGPAEILENGKYGRLVTVGNSDALAEAILQETRTPLVDKQALINRSKDFSEKEIASQYLTVIHEVVHARL